MVRVSYEALVFTLVAVALGTHGCQSDPSSPPAPSDPQTEKGSWAVYTPYDWTHDGHSHPSRHVTIYSDAATDAVKMSLAAIADDRWDRILALFDSSDVSGFRYPPGSSTIDIYINRNHPEGINWAYWGGFIITIRSDDISGFWRDYAVYTVRHELTHEFEFLTEGREALGTDVWFREGLAVHVGCLEPTGWSTIRSLAELEAWISQNQGLPGRGNPIGIHHHDDYPEGADRHEYYRLFELAVTYMLDERGLGGSYQDVAGLFYDARDGDPFFVSFEDRFDISLSDYEAQFFDRMRMYLGDGP